MKSPRVTCPTAPCAFCGARTPGTMRVGGKDVPVCSRGACLSAGAAKVAGR
jgi:hypothetical protein